MGKMPTLAHPMHRCALRAGHAMLELHPSPATGMPPRPGPLQRIGLLLLSLALPALMLVVAGACFFALTSTGNHDRTLAWVSGTPAQLAALERAVATHPVFRHGQVAAGAFEEHRPTSCGPGMVSASFSRLHDYEVRVARATLDQLVRDAGATPCRAHAFVFNDLPNPFDPGDWNDSVQVVLLVLLIPAGSLVLAYWSCSAQFALPRALESGWPTAHTLLASGAVAVAGIAWAALLGWLDRQAGGAGGLPADVLGLPSPSLGILPVVALYAPFLEEVAFRAWLVPIATRAVGHVAAAGLSAIAFAAVYLPGGPAMALAWLGIGLLLALLFLRTRSVAACLLAHGGCNALALGASWFAAG